MQIFCPIYCFLKKMNDIMLVSRGKEGSTMKNLFWMLTGTEADTSGLKESAQNLMTQVWEVVNIVIWILVAILAVIFIFKAVTTAMAVMKAADEPQVRQEKIQGFKYLAIGLGIAIVVLVFANVIIDLIMNTASENTLNQPTSFLF
jgi:heme/copper-type cytochrome/quinol oxidase subunit 2